MGFLSQLTDGMFLLSDVSRSSFYAVAFTLQVIFSLHQDDLAVLNGLKIGILGYTRRQAGSTKYIEESVDWSEFRQKFKAIQCDKSC